MADPDSERRPDSDEVSRPVASYKSSYQLDLWKDWANSSPASFSLPGSLSNGQCKVCCRPCKGGEVSGGSCASTAVGCWVGVGWTSTVSESDTTIGGSSYSVNGFGNDLKVSRTGASTWLQELFDLLQGGRWPGNSGCAGTHCGICFEVGWL